MSSSLRTLPGSREDLASAETLFDLLSDPEVETVTRLVGATAGLDLRRYQRSAVVRAVLRRMALAGEGDVENYLGRLAADALELRQLCRDLLVSDTAFFRDADAFAVVRDTVIKPLVRAAHGDPVRVWVVGCATGEEAYALAMLFLEAAEGLAPAPALRVFATDVDGAALDKAREGIYPASIADRIDLVAASRSRLETFFTHCEGGYQVSDRLRDVVTFGAHDVAHDAPLARIDLVSCRNLVGHLTDARRDVVVSRLCQALRPGGHLFLGAGESPGDGASQLNVAAPSAHLFSRIDDHTVSGAMPVGQIALQRAAWYDDEMARASAEVEATHEELRLVDEELAWVKARLRRAQSVIADAERRHVADRQRAAVELEEASHRMDQYLGMLGHELRNPLAAILAASDVLERRETKDPVVDRTSVILARQTGHMAKIVDGLLDVSRISRGKIDLVREPMDVITSVASLLADYEGRAVGRGLVFERASAVASLWVDGDRMRIIQVLDGILANAIQFTPSGIIRVSFEQDEEAVIRVQDTGVGIEPSLLPHVFEPFWQGPQSYDRPKGGLGLGLALVRGLVELHGGTVSASSAGRDSGTEICVRLPLIPPPEAALAPAATEEARPLSILVVEDNVDAAVMVVELLVEAGHEAHLAHDGPGALASALHLVPDVILCDLGLPGEMTGYDVARAVRNHAELAGTRLVALSGYGRPEDKTEAKRAGFDLHLTKPVDFRTLSTALSS